MKYVATIYITEQVSEDRWIYRPYTKEIEGHKPFSELTDETGSNLQNGLNDCRKAKMYHYKYVAENA